MYGVLGGWLGDLVLYIVVWVIDRILCVVSRVIWCFWWWLVGVKSVDRLIRRGCRVFWVVDTVIWWFARCSG